MKCRNAMILCAQGLLGCRWKKEREKYDQSVCDKVWILILGATFLYAAFWLYFWVVNGNTEEYIDWFLGKETGKYFEYYIILLSLACVIAVYLSILVILNLYLARKNATFYIFLVHKIVIIIIVLSCGLSCWIISWLFHEGWSLMILSVMMTGPYLHAVAVLIITCLGFFFLSHGLNQSDLCGKATWIVPFTLVLFTVYLFPIAIDSPCVIEKNSLPAKPKLVAHKGDSARYPENTRIAFERAVQDLHGNTSAQTIAFESDVTMSFDGVPFIFHDSWSTERTTNVGQVFPTLIKNKPCMFNFSDIQKLNAGSWFLKRDPFRSAYLLNEFEQRNVRNQSIPTLAELLDIANQYGKNVMFDIIFKCGSEHPYYGNVTDFIIEEINKHGIPKQNIWWLNEYHVSTSDYTRVWSGKPKYLPENETYMLNGSIANIYYPDISISEIKKYHGYNLSINIYLVNSKWLFSLYWCAGVSSVTTDMPFKLASLSKPIWRMTRLQFFILWAIVDAVSLTLLLIYSVCLLCHKKRKDRKQTGSAAIAGEWWIPSEEITNTSHTTHF